MTRTGKSTHDHDLSTIDTAIAALAQRTTAMEALGVVNANAIAALAARVKALEPPPIASRLVTSVPDLLAALSDDSLDELVLRNGTHAVRPAAERAANSLWIDRRYARTRPVLVRPEAPGGVTFDGGGATYFGGLTFVDGACLQTWDDFAFANGTPTQTGVIVFGGYPGKAAPHHITLRDTRLLGSLRTASTGSGDHGLYFAHAVGGPHDILIDGMTVDGSGGLDSAVHAYHSDAANANAWNIAIRHLRVTGTDQAIVLWDNTIHDWTFEDVTVTGATSCAVRYESTAQRMAFRRCVSSGTPNGRGWISSLGAAPAGVTQEACSWA